MAERISGTGEIRREGATFAVVSYQLNVPSRPEGDAFTDTDGVIEVEDPEYSDASTLLEPGEEVTLHLQAPLSDGTSSLRLIIEPYEGHRPDERYQVRVQGAG